MRTNSSQLRILLGRGHSLPQELALLCRMVRSGYFGLSRRCRVGLSSLLEVLLGLEVLDEPVESPEPAPDLRSEGLSVFLESVRRRLFSEDESGWIMRLLETSGTQQQVEISILGRPVARQTIQPWELLTLRLVRDGHNWVATRDSLTEIKRDVQLCHVLHTRL